MCFVQGSPGPMWLCRKLPEILRKYSPLLQGGGRRGMRPAQPFLHWALPASPSARLALPPAAVTYLSGHPVPQARWTNSPFYFSPEQPEGQRAPRGTFLGSKP